MTRRYVNSLDGFLTVYRILEPKPCAKLKLLLLPQGAALERTRRGRRPTLATVQRAEPSPNGLTPWATMVKGFNRRPDSIKEITMRVQRSTAAVIGMLAILALAAPGRASGAPAGACSLLTQAQVQAALGVTVSAPPPASTGKICQWQGPPGKPGTRQMAVVTIQDANAFAFAKKPSTSPTLVKTAVTGVGDDAVFNTIGVVTTTLTVKTGDAYFEVHVYGFSEEQTKAMEKTLALEIVRKLH